MDDEEDYYNQQLPEDEEKPPSPLPVEVAVDSGAPTVPVVLDQQD